jgi:hypothetical protein
MPTSAASHATNWSRGSMHAHQHCFERVPSKPLPSRPRAKRGRCSRLQTLTGRTYITLSCPPLSYPSLTRPALRCTSRRPHLQHAHSAWRVSTRQERACTVRPHRSMAAWALQRPGSMTDKPSAPGTHLCPCQSLPERSRIHALTTGLRDSLRSAASSTAGQCTGHPASSSQARAGIG